MLTEIEQQLRAASLHLDHGESPEAFERLARARKLIPHLKDSQRLKGQGFLLDIIDLESRANGPKAA